MIQLCRSVLINSLIVSSALTFSATAVAQTTDDETKDDEQASTIEQVYVFGRQYSAFNAESFQPVTVLTGNELAHRRQGTLGETLNGLPGIHLDSFGAGASRPVIRGQTVPRIEILSDGANLFDASSVSPDHAIVTDPLLLDAIEVVRGPAAVRYGGNAMNGAVNLIDSKVPRALPQGGVKGAAEMRFGSGDNEKTFAGRVTAGLGDFAFHAEGSKHSSSDYDIPDEYGSDKLRDSFADSDSYSFGASWIIDKGYIGAAYTKQEAEYGLPGHSHTNAVCHTHGRDLHCAAHDEFDDPFGSSDDHTAYIDLRSERIDIRADYKQLLPGVEHTRLRLSYTDYVHDEIDGPALFSEYTNEVYDGRIELTHQPLFGFTGTFGVQYTDGTFTGLNVNDLHQSNENSFGQLFEELYGISGVEWGLFGRDRYLTENIGIFLTERRSIGPVDVELAIRQDWRDIHLPPREYRFNFPDAALPFIEPVYSPIYGPEWRTVIPEDAEQRYIDEHPSAEHKPLSASIGATWNLADGYSVALSVAHIERAPSVRELYAYGNNLATNSYELGLTQASRASSRLPESRPEVMETADALNLTLRKAGGPLEFEIGLFYQDVEDYIFARLIEQEDETGIPHNYLVYTASDAKFAGMDGQISYQLSDQARVTLFGDYVDTDLTSEEVDVTLDNTGDNLPRIPASRLGVRYDWASGPLAADIEFYRVNKQDDVALYETPTAGYNMLNMTLSYGFNNDATEVYLRGTNLTDELAYVHTSFVKEQSPLRGRNFVLGLKHQL